MPQDGGAAAGGDLRPDRRDRRTLRVRDLFAFFPVVLPRLRPIAGGVAAGAPDRGIKKKPPGRMSGQLWLSLRLIFFLTAAERALVALLVDDGGVIELVE